MKSSLALRTAALAALALAAFLASPVVADTPAFDINHFDCGIIRRDLDRLELDRTTSDGPVTTVFDCFQRSCVNRMTITAADGTTSEVFRYVYLPRYRQEYVSSWAMWREGSDAPAIHRTKVYQFVDCK